MIKIIYDAKRGSVVRDGDAVQYIDGLIELHNMDVKVEVSVSNAIVITALQLAVKKGLLNIMDLQIINAETSSHIQIKDNGKILGYPKGFCDIQLQLEEELMGWSNDGSNSMEK